MKLTCTFGRCIHTPNRTFMSRLSKVVIKTQENEYVRPVPRSLVREKHLVRYLISECQAMARCSAEQQHVAIVNCSRRGGGVGVEPRV